MWAPTTGGSATEKDIDRLDHLRVIIEDMTHVIDYLGWTGTDGGDAY